MNTPFRSFADVEANNHHILLPPDTTEAIVETLGSPKNVLTGNAELFAYTDYLGQALMHAALIELRGTSSENPPLVEQTRRLIQEKPSLREARDELEKTADGLLRSGWEINGKYENPRDVAVEGFNVGMALSGLAKNVTLLANHPTAYPNISTSTSRGGGKHTDRDMIHPVTAQEDRQEIGYALNTNPGKAIVLSTHSYVESMDKILKFTVPTTYLGHSTVANVMLHTPPIRYNTMEIDLTAESYHVDVREHAVEVTPRRYGTLELLRSINASLQIAVHG